MLNNNNIIWAKLQSPHLGNGIIERSRLLSELRTYKERKVTCVIAPAGYGKTVFIKQFVSSIKVPVVWYQLDSFDNDPVQFFSYLICGLSTSIPGLHLNIPELGSEGIKTDKKYYNLMASMINELESKADKGLVVVFDDFHLITEPEILEFMDYFLNYIPRTVHVILSGRYQPKLQLLRLKASGNIMEINQQNLEFNLSEIRALFYQENEKYPDEEFINTLNGWALGLSLVRLALGRSWNSTADLIMFKAKNEIFNYFSNELLKSIPQEIQEFLIFTSVLEILTPESCNYMLDLQDAAKKLEYIEKRNLFIVATGSVGNISYRYHHVFKEFLLNQLAEKRTKTFRKAGRYYQENGMCEQAVACFISADDYGLLAETIERSGQLMLQQGRLRTVERWLQYLHDRNYLNSPQLILIQGAWFSYMGKFAEAEQWIERAIALFQTNMDNTGLCQAIIHQSRIMRYRGSINDSLSLLDSMTLKFDEVPTSYYLEAMTEKVFSLWLKGNIKDAIAVAEATFAVSKNHSAEKTMSRLLAYMAVINYILGDYSKAIKHYEMIRQECTNNLDANALGLAGLFIAKLWRDRGEPDKALQMLKEAIDRKQCLGIKEELHILYFNMGIFYLDLHDRQKAEIYFETAVEQFKETGGKQDYYVLMIQAVKSALLKDVQADHLEFEILIEEAVRSLRSNSDFFLVFASTFFIIGYMRRGMMDHAENLLDEILFLSERIGMKQSIAVLSGLKAGIMAHQASAQTNLPYIIRCLKDAAYEQYIQSFLTFPELWISLSLGIQHDIEPEFTGQIIRRLGARATPMLIEMLRNDQSAVRVRAIRLLQEVADAKVCQELSKLFFDRDENIRKSAQLVLLSTKQLSGQSFEPVWVEGQTKLFISCFGTFNVYTINDWDNPVKWRTAKAKELFAYLVHQRGKSVCKEEIITDLWSETAIEQVSGLLHTNIYYLRQLLKSCGLENNLIYSQGKYKMDLAGVVCDAVIFNNIFVNTRASIDPATVLSLQEAVSLYQGEYFAGQDWTWNNNVSEFYGKSCLSMLKEIVNYYLGEEKFQKAKGWLEAILKISPLEEEAYLTLMQVFAEMGDRIGVERKYRELCKVLNEELGIEPDQRAKDLYHQLSGTEPACYKVTIK